MSKSTVAAAHSQSARRRLAKQGVLWLTKRIGGHALQGDWQSALDAAASRDQLLSTVSDADTGIFAMRAAADEARAILSEHGPAGAKPANDSTEADA